MSTVIETFYNLAGENFDILYRSETKDYFFVYMYDERLDAVGIPFTTKKEAFEFAITYIAVWNDNYSKRF